MVITTSGELKALILIVAFCAAAAIGAFLMLPHRHHERTQPKQDAGADENGGDDA